MRGEREYEDALDLEGSNPQVSQQWAANRQEHHSQNHPQASRCPHRNCALHRWVDPTACGLRVLRSLPRRLVQRRSTAFRPATNSRLMLARRAVFVRLASRLAGLSACQSQKKCHPRPILAKPFGSSLHPESIREPLCSFMSSLKRENSWFFRLASSLAACQSHKQCHPGPLLAKQIWF